MRIALLALSLLASQSHAQLLVTPEEKARAELESQLGGVLKKNPPKIDVQWQPLNEKGYKLLGVEFKLDGQSLPAPPLEKIREGGPHSIIRRKVDPGFHTLTTKVIYTDVPTSFFSVATGTRWKVSGTITFRADINLLVTVKSIAVLDKKADPEERLRLRSDVQVEMIETYEAEPEPAPPLVAQAPTPPPAIIKTPPPMAPQMTVTPVAPKKPSAGMTKGIVAVSVTSNKRPIASTIRVLGPENLEGKTLPGAGEPTRLGGTEGKYTVIVQSPGYLSQMRSVLLEAGKEAPVSIDLVKRPKKSLVQVKGNKLFLTQAMTFATGNSLLSSQHSKILAEVVDALAEYPNFKLKVEGHTDNQEGQFRQKLSEARAKAVFDWLARNGVSESRLEMAGFGDNRPKAPNLTARGRTFNRRVELLLMDSAQTTAQAGKDKR